MYRSGIGVVFANSNSNSRIGTFFDSRRIQESKCMRNLIFPAPQNTTFCVVSIRPIPIRPGCISRRPPGESNSNVQEIAFLLIPNTQLFVLCQFGQFQFNSHCILVKAAAGETQRRLYPIIFTTQLNLDPCNYTGKHPPQKKGNLALLP